MYDDIARQRETSRRRMQVLMGVFALMAAVMVVRLSYLQLLSAEEYRQAIRNWVDLPPEYLEPLRGDVLDRHGTVLAQDAPCWQVEAYYQAFDPEIARNGQSVYVQNRAIRQLRAAGYKGRIPLEVRQEEEQKVHETIAAGWQRLSDLVGVPSWQILSNTRQITDRVRRIREVQASRMHLDEDPSRAPLVMEEKAFHPILQNISAEAAKAIRENLPETRYPWIRVSISGSRQYVDDPSIAPLLGNMRQVSQEDLDNDPHAGDDLRGLDANSRIGSGGIERTAESVLRGQRGKISRNKRNISTVESEPVRGRDVHLTIDAELQSWIYKRLGQVVRGNPTASAAAAVVLDVETREVLAAVSWPGYTHKDLSDADTARRLLKDAIRQPTYPRAICGQYEPGSIAKPITVLAALNSGVIGSGETVNCTGYFIPGQKGWRCWTVASGIEPHGPTDAVAALQHSCNIYCVTVGQRLGVARLTDWMLRFGMGAVTGTGLAEEQNGLVPTLEWYSRKNRTPSAADVRNFSIGEGEVQVTPLQAANISATIASGIWRPITLVRELPPTDRPAHRLGGSAEHLRQVREGMYRVVNDPSGTAYRSAHSSVGIAGKTGTAEGSVKAYAFGYDVKMHDGVVKTMEFADPHEAQEEFARLGEAIVEHKHSYTKYWPFAPSSDNKPTHAWFMGYAPHDSPKIAVAVLIEYGGGGAKVAGPVARDIFERYFGVQADARNSTEDP